VVAAKWMRFFKCVDERIRMFVFRGVGMNHLRFCALNLE
jgi:hypothetical protein